MQDPLEGVTHGELLNRLSEDKLHEYSLSKTFENAISQKYPKSQLEKDEENLEFRQKQYFVNSWFLDSRESVAMWDLYANKFGVALKIEPEKLYSFVRNPSNYKLRKDFVLKRLYGKVVYKDYFNEDELRKSSFKRKYVAFRKDQSWQHEREFRMVIYTKRKVVDLNGKPLESGIPSTGIDLEVVDFSILNPVVVFHPKMKEWVKENYRKTVHHSKLKGKIDFQDSELFLR